jgi:hypothetical protein
LIDPGSIETIDFHISTSQTASGNEDHEMIIDICQKNFLVSSSHIIPIKRLDDTDNKFIFVDVSTKNCKYGFTYIYDLRANGDLTTEVTRFIESVDHDMKDLLSTGSCFDEHLQDQFIFLMFLAHGTSKFSIAKVEPHTLAMKYIAELIGAEMDIVNENGQNVVIIKGIGYNPINLYRS